MYEYCWRGDDWMTKCLENNLVSIIMPIYNCEDKLCRSIDSVLGQTYKNLQLILIDDGSIDDSPLICDQYAKVDSRVEVIHQRNAGASLARNHGLEHVKGEFVTFVDADDMISDLYIEVLLLTAMNTNTKIATCEAKYCKASCDRINELEFQTDIKPQIIKVEDYNFMEPWSHATVWGALFHRDLLHNLKFDTDILVGEDALFFANALAKCKNVSYISQKLYYYYIYDESVSHGTYNEKRLTEFQAWEKINSLLTERSNVLNTSSKARMVRHAIERFKEATSQNVDDKRILGYLQKIIQINKQYYLNYNPSIKARMDILFITKMPRLFATLYKIHKN